MKSSLKAKLIQHFASQKGNAGFTLIELLVVIIIIGILSAIALPSFLNQANKARQSEAKTYVGSLNRAQQAHRLENKTFSGTIEDLGIGISTDTEFYDYTVDPTTGTGFGAMALATPNDVGVKGYLGAVQLTQKAATTGTGNQDATTLAVLCEALTPGVAPPTTEASVANYDSAAVATVDIECTGTVKAIQ